MHGIFFQNDDFCCITCLGQINISCSVPDVVPCGLQICFITTVVAMVVRLDAYSVLYGIFLGVLMLLSRRHCYFLWPAYTILLVVLLVMQYLSCLGAPPVLCWGKFLGPVSHSLLTTSKRGDN